MSALGRRTPEDWTHVDKYPLRAVMAMTVSEVNKTLKLPYWHWKHDQGNEGSCVGHGSSMMMSILNRHRYNPFWLWNQSKIVDEWADTNPGDNNGTSVRASCDVLRSQGHTRWGKEDPKTAEGIATNRWATNVDQIRTAISEGIPVSIGVTWWSNFDDPVKKGNHYYIGEGNLGTVRGGHCLCIYGASDRRQAFRLKNSWGRSFPLVWLPYKTMQTLLEDYGEATLVTDR